MVIVKDIKAKREINKISLNSWDAELIANLLDCEIGNTDGWSDKEYARMSVLERKFREISLKQYNKELEKMK